MAIFFIYNVSKHVWINQLISFLFPVNIYILSMHPGCPVNLVDQPVAFG